MTQVLREACEKGGATFYGTGMNPFTRVFADSVLMMADCFDLTLDEVTFSYELGVCT